MDSASESENSVVEDMDFSAAPDAVTVLEGGNAEIVLVTAATEEVVEDVGGTAFTASGR
jgi:hypothetical protein